MSLCCFNAVPRITSLSRRTARTKTERKEKPTNGSNSLGFGRERRDPLWQCVQGCGACCKLDKGPNFLSPEEIFNDPSDVQLYKSLTGRDGWCIHFDKNKRTCSIYSGKPFSGLFISYLNSFLLISSKIIITVDRPFFCRVEPDIFQTLYGINKEKFNKEACRCNPSNFMVY